MPKYEIRYCPIRARRGHKAWAIFEIVDAFFSRGVGFYSTKPEAQSAMNSLKAREGKMIP